MYPSERDTNEEVVLEEEFDVVSLDDDNDSAQDDPSMRAIRY